MQTKLGLIHVYTGDGKGKTTAAMGLVLRAIGQGYKSCVIQFMKGGYYTGEFISFKQFLPNNDFMQFGRGCIKQKTQLTPYQPAQEKPPVHILEESIDCGTCRWCFLNDDTQKQFCTEALTHAKKVAGSGEFDVVLLDEINVAVHFKMIELQDVLDMIKNKHAQTELILTGRDAHPKILELADLVTCMTQIKHYYDKGVMARKGIEY
ncbi:cob(I)yrinic acid a,c-diamide adenosyltransferase [Candidatus Woesearchaeota archaeon]|nr:cob(I)yrinic acid a,c-diamide adenosyltransferase [Candidatus Woesearchaeota archaeon]